MIVITLNLNDCAKLTDKSIEAFTRHSRALAELFRLADERADGYEYAIVVSMMEVYNEQVRDLLVPAPVQTDPDRPPPQPKALNLQNRLQGGVTVVGSATAPQGGEAPASSASPPSSSS